jgi:hypothetical protein
LKCRGFDVSSPDVHVVSGNLPRNFLLNYLYEFVFTLTIINENYLFSIVSHTSHTGTEHNSRKLL